MRVMDALSPARRSGTCSLGQLSWARIARACEAARGNDGATRAFRNTILVETRAETGEAPDWQLLASHREAWKPRTVPEGGLILTDGADVQRDRIEVDVWVWGRALESCLAGHAGGSCRAGGGSRVRSHAADCATASRS